MQPSSHLPLIPSRPQSDNLLPSPDQPCTNTQDLLPQHQLQPHQCPKLRQLRPHHLLQLFQLYPLSFNLLRSLLSSVSSIREQDNAPQAHALSSGAQPCLDPQHPQAKDQESNHPRNQELASSPEQTMQAQAMTSMDTILSEMNRILTADPTFHLQVDTDATTSHWQMDPRQHQQYPQSGLSTTVSSQGTAAASGVDTSTVIATPLLNTPIRSTTPHSPLVKNTDGRNTNTNLQGSTSSTPSAAQQNVDSDSTLSMETTTTSPDLQQQQPSTIPSLAVLPSEISAQPSSHHPATASAQSNSPAKGSPPGYSQELQRPSHGSCLEDDSMLKGNDAAPPSWLWDAYRRVALSAVDTILSRHQDHYQLRQDQQEDQRQQQQQFSDTDTPMDELYEHPQFHHRQQQPRPQLRQTLDQPKSELQDLSGQKAQSPLLDKMEGIESENSQPSDSGHGNKSNNTDNNNDNNNKNGATNWYDPTLELATKALTALSTLSSTGIESLMVDSLPPAPLMARRASSPNCSAGSMGTISRQLWSSSTGPIRRWSSNKNPQLYSDPSTCPGDISGVTPLSALPPPSAGSSTLSSSSLATSAGSALGPLFGTASAAGSASMGPYPFLSQHRQEGGTTGLFWEQQQQECGGINSGTPYSLEIDMMNADQAAGARGTTATTTATGTRGMGTGTSLGTNPMVLDDNNTDLTALLAEDVIARLGATTSDTSISPLQPRLAISASASPSASPTPSPTLSFNFGGSSSTSPNVSSMMALGSTSPPLGAPGVHGNSPHHHPHPLSYQPQLQAAHSAMLAAAMSVTATSSYSKSLVPPILPCPLPNCPKTFARIYNLNAHIKAHHQQNDMSASNSPLVHALGLSPLSGTATTTTMTTTTTTTTAAPSTTTASTTATSPKSFACHLCPRIFSRKHDLQRHIRVHTGSKPYLCLNCQKAFARTDALCRHYKVEEACRRVVVELEADEEIRKMQQTQVQQQLQMELREMQLAQKHQQQKLLLIQHHHHHHHQQQQQQQLQHQLQYRQVLSQAQLQAQGQGEVGGGQGSYQGQNQGHLGRPGQQSREQLAFQMAMSSFP